MAHLKQAKKYSKGLLAWVQSQLNILIGADDFAPLLLSLDDVELTDYCINLLGETDECLSFINEIIGRRTEELLQKQNQSNTQTSNQKQKQKNKANKNQKQKQKAKGKNEGKRNDSNVMTIDQKDIFNVSKKKPLSQSSVTPTPKPSAQPTSYRKGGAMTITHVPISKKSTNTSKKGKTRKRKMCGCQATLHDVFKNCTECGYILCIIEGEGPCFHCSAFVTLAGTISNIDASKASFEHTKSDSYQKAIAQKEKLLKFGRDKISQTTIIDDQGDFYENEANNLWLTSKEREIAAQKAKEQEDKLNASRADKPIEIAINFDAKRGTVSLENADERDEYKKSYIFASVDREKELQQKRLQQLKEAQNANSSSTKQLNSASTSWYHNASLTGHASQVYASLQKLMDLEQQSKNKSQGKTKDKAKEKETDKSDEAVSALRDKFVTEANEDDDGESKSDRLDDEKEEKVSSKSVRNIPSNLSKSKLEKMRRKMRSKYGNQSDEGVCLSMHQPWASLLVLGIKKVEGRSWATKYRGRLWIASARREPTPFEIDEVEQQYCNVYGLSREQIPFPKEYPTTALLGCVDMIDCLSNEEYNKQYVESGLSTENNASSFCFLCDNPRRLMLPGAISGEHKLWKMPQERLKPMQAGLIPCDLSWMPEEKTDTKKDSNPVKTS